MSTGDDVDEHRDRKPGKQQYERQGHDRGVTTGAVPYTSSSSASPCPPPEQIAAKPSPPPFRRNS
jgi:hypothetical protein